MAEKLIQWWIDAFIHSLPARSFIHRQRAGERLQKRVLARNAQYQLQFRPNDAGDLVEIVPQCPEAEWARGIIFIDGIGKKRFMTVTVEELRTLTDEMD